LGYNPMQVLLGNAELAHLPHATAVYLTSRQFFPRLIAPAFSKGLTEAFSFAAVVCLLGALASLLRGGKYHYAEVPASASAGAEPIDLVPAPPIDHVPAQEAVAETDALMLD
jgi:hypothetical protein